VGATQGSPRPFSLGPLPEAFIDGTEGYIEAIQKLDKTLSRQTILDSIKHEVDTAGGLLTQEGAAALLYKMLLEPEKPEEPEPEGPPGYTPAFTSAAGQRVATATELQITKELTEATGLSADHFAVEEGSEGIIVKHPKFLGDRFNQANTLLEGMGFSYVTDNNTKERMWVMNKPKEKKPTQQSFGKPKSIREAEAILIDKFGPTILKTLTVTEDARSIDVEPGAKLPPKQQEAITNLLTKYGGTLTDTGMPPGYVWVIPK
jgi:hypothetical protein